MLNTEKIGVKIMDRIPMFFDLFRSRKDRVGEQIGEGARSVEIKNGQGELTRRLEDHLDGKRRSRKKIENTWEKQRDRVRRISEIKNRAQGDSRSKKGYSVGV